MMMKRRTTIVVALLAILFLMTLAVIRRRTSHELVLKMNGLPLANLRAQVLPNGSEAEVLGTSTDVDGRLDFSAIPAGTQMIAITLWDGTAPALNASIFLDWNASTTIDFRGKRTITTRKRTYADLLLFKLTGQDISEAVQY
jgi:hypothetical protein